MGLIDVSNSPCNDCDEEVCYGCMELRDWVDEAPTVELPRWIPVTERLPERFGQFIVTVKNDLENGYSDYADYDPYLRSWRTGLGLHGSERITHWMPLPEPPKED